MTGLATRPPFVTAKLLAVVSLLLAGLAIAAARVPAPGRVVVTSTVCEVLDEVRFDGEATVAQPSLRTVDAVARTLVNNPTIVRVEVGANTLPRARAVIDHLIAGGVAPERLEAGLTDRETAQFLILERSPE